MASLNLNDGTREGADLGFEPKACPFPRASCLPNGAPVVVGGRPPGKAGSWVWRGWWFWGGS